MQKFDKTVVVGLPQELYDTLKKLPKEDCRSIPSFIRKLLRKYAEEK